MDPESSTYIFVVILVYLLGVLAVLLWGYLTTKIVFSIVSKERVVFRVICWPILGWFLLLAFYLMFVIAVGLFGITFESLI